MKLQSLLFHKVSQFSIFFANWFLMRIRIVLLFSCSFCAVVIWCVCKDINCVCEMFIFIITIYIYIYYIQLQEKSQKNIHFFHFFCCDVSNLWYSMRERKKKEQFWTALSLKFGNSDFLKQRFLNCTLHIIAFQHINQFCSFLFNYKLHFHVNFMIKSQCLFWYIERWRISCRIFISDTMHITNIIKLFLSLFLLIMM